MCLERESGGIPALFLTTNLDEKLLSDHRVDTAGKVVNRTHSALGRSRSDCS